MTALLDTGFLFAVFDQNDKHHSAVTGVLHTLNEPLVLPVPVLPEICYLLASRLGHSQMRAFLRGLTTQSITLEAIIGADLVRIIELLEQYADNKLDFVDASIVAIAERLNITRILTIDQRDFRMIRPVHCPFFEILPA